MIEREPDGELRFRGPAGQLLPEVPPAHTATPGWLGERLHVGYAIDVLHPRAANEQG